VGLESTGGYENNFLRSLLDLKNEYDLEIFRVNPLSLKRYSNVDLHRAKTDKTNAVDIANYIRSKDVYPIKSYSPEMKGLRNIIRRIEADTKTESAARTNLLILIHEVFPELIQHCGNGIPAWVLGLLCKYQCINELAEADVKEIEEIPYINNVKAGNLINMAKKSILINHDIDYLTKISIKKCCKRIMELMKDISEMKLILRKEYRRISNNKLATIDGIGDYTAAILTTFTGDVKRFLTVKKYIAFFGLDPVIKDSGDESKVRRISKKGESVVRKVLYTSVLSCLKNKKHPVTKMYYRLTQRGIHHYSAMTACMRKLLSIVYGILNSGKDFDINYENTNKSEKQSSKSIKDKKIMKKKSESNDLEAPISKRERNRRKKVATS
jgi:transposase